MLGAYVVDAFGTGLFVPYAYLYYSTQTRLSVGEVGAAISLATLIALACSTFTGPAIDRLGAGRMVLVGYALEAAGYLLSSQAGSLLTLVAVAVAIQLGIRIVFPANSAVAAEIAPGARRDMFFASKQALRNGGLSVGVLCGGVLVGVAHGSGFLLVALLDGGSYVLALLLMLPQRAVRARGDEPAGPADRRARWAVLRDRPYLALVTANGLTVLAFTALEIAMPLYLVQHLGVPASRAGLVFGANAILVSLLQVPVTYRTQRLPRRAAFTVGAGLLALSFVPLVVLGSGPVGDQVLLAVVVGFVILNVAGELLVSPTSYSLAAGLAPPGARGVYLSAFHSSFTVVALVSPSLFAFALAADSRLLWGLVVVSCAGAAALAAGPVGRARVQEPEAGDRSSGRHLEPKAVGDAVG